MLCFIEAEEVRSTGVEFHTLPSTRSRSMTSRLCSQLLPLQAASNHLGPCAACTLPHVQNLQQGTEAYDVPERVSSALSVHKGLAACV